jgi:hypothetical protein
MTATSTPDPITNVSATATGADGQATVKFDAPPSHGATSTVQCTWSGGGCGTWTLPAGGQTGVSEPVSGLPNGSGVTLDLQDCNGSPGGKYAGNPCDSTVGASVTTYGPLRTPVIQASASGQVVNFTVSDDPNGKTATVTVQTSKQGLGPITIGPGAWSWGSADGMGYSATDTITVTVSDPGRGTQSQTVQVSTPAPPPTVTVTKGAACGGGGGAACKGGSCSDPSCAYVHVQTANFPGSVTCNFDSSHGNSGWVQGVAYGPNDSHDSVNWFGFPGYSVTVTCNGVQGEINSWS